MKTTPFYHLAVLCLIALLSMSCNNKPDNELELEYPADVGGTYNGEIRVLYDARYHEVVPARVIISKVDRRSISIQLKWGMPAEIISIEDIELSPLKVATKSARECNFEAKQVQVNAVGADGTPITLLITVYVRLYYLIDYSKHLSIDIASNDNPHTIMSFTGVPLTGTERKKAELLSFTLNNDPVVTSEPVIDKATRTISFSVAPTATDMELHNISFPRITVSEGAKTYPFTGSGNRLNLDFNRENRRFGIVSEDGSVVNVYQIKITKKEKQ
jgi:hypothetical protein